MTARYGMTWVDHAGQRSNSALYFASPTGAAFDWDTYVSDVEAVGDLLEAISDCVLDGETITEVMATVDGTPASTATARREIGIRVFYSDVTEGTKYHFTIPGPEVAEYPDQGSEDIDLTAGDMALLVAGLEADCVSPLGNAISINSAKFVGRNS